MKKETNENKNTDVTDDLNKEIMDKEQDKSTLENNEKSEDG